MDRYFAFAVERPAKQFYPVKIFAATKDAALARAKRAYPDATGRVIEVGECEATQEASDALYDKAIKQAEKLTKKEAPTGCNAKTGELW